MSVLDEVDRCAHGNPKTENVRGKLKPGYCPYCRRDEKYGAAMAKDAYNTDPVFRQEVRAIAMEMLVRGRQERCKGAIMAALPRRPDLERSLRLGEGVWWDELAPLKPDERGIVIAELKRRWGLTQHADMN